MKEVERLGVEGGECRGGGAQEKGTQRAKRRERERNRSRKRQREKETKRESESE